MSNTEEITQTPRSLSSRFSISFEIVLIYLATGLILITFFESIQVALYATLGYIALFMALSVFVVMVSYTVWNFSKAIYILVTK